MKKAFAFLFIGLSLLPLSKAEWPNQAYSEVRAYVFSPKGPNPSIITNGKLDPSVTNSQGVLLSHTQVRKLITALTGSHPMRPLAACFDPHHAFVFYDSNKKPVAKVDVCFGCQVIEADPEGTAFPDDLVAIAELCAELKLPGAPSKEQRDVFAGLTRPAAVAKP